MKQRVAEMEREAEKLRELQAAAESATSRDGSDGAAQPEEEKAAVDGRSVFVGNVRSILEDFMTPLHCAVTAGADAFFSAFLVCRSIIVLLRRSCRHIFRRVARLIGLPSFATSLLAIQKGRSRNRAVVNFCPSHGFSSRFAYVEFAEPEFVDAAMALDNSLFRGRLIKVRVCSFDRTACSESPSVTRSRRNERTFQGLTGVAVAGPTGVVTEVVTAVQVMATHTALAEGVFSIKRSD